MQHLFDRYEIRTFPLSKRKNKLVFDDLRVDPAAYEVALSPEAQADVKRCADEIRRAKDLGAARMLTFGAHTIKNGLSPVLARLMQEGWITHFATNGAGFIHDWEFAYQGQSGEDVQKYVAEGQFGIWEETGKYLNLALILGAADNRGYGKSIGRLIHDGGFEIPEVGELTERCFGGDEEADEEGFDITSLAQIARVSDLVTTLATFLIPPGWLDVHHVAQDNSLAYYAFENDVPFTCHPMIGHDIIYTHPLCNPAAIGRAAETDFLEFVDSVSHLEGGVYLSLGSAVMSPMIFEKALSMARNVAKQKKRKISDFSIHVVDLAPSTWDWTSSGEPPMDNPAYYLRYCKTFSRMGGRMSYTSADNRSWLVALWRELQR